MGGLEHGFRFDGPPAEVFEEGQPVLGCELERCVCEIPAMFLLICVFRPGKAKSSIHQATSGRLIAPESAAMSAVLEVHRQTLGQHEGLRRAVQRVVEEGVTGVRDGEVDGGAGQPASRGLVGKQLRLFCEQLG